MEVSFRGKIIKGVKLQRLKELEQLNFMGKIIIFRSI